jgi:O-antigen ligase/tetratricopeptide (TPR) repeat protein
MEQFNKWLKWGLYIGVFAVPFIPFIISTTYFFPFITGKNFTFRILIDVLFALYLLLAFRDPAYRPRFSWVSISVLALASVATIATITSVDPIKSFWSNFERMEGLVGLAHLVIWFYITGAILSTDKLWNRFLQMSIFASVIMGAYVVLQVGGAFTINQGGVRTDGTFGNAIYLAVYMLFHIFFTLFIMVRHRGASWMHAFYILALLLQLTSLYFAATRSATLGVIGGLLVTSLSIAFADRENKKVRIAAIGGICAVVLIVAGFFAIRTSSFVMHSPVLSRFSSISAEDGTIRFVIWKMASQGVAEHPLFGWGPENFNFVFNKYYDPNMWGQEQWFDRAHNAYIDWAIAGGILGLLAFIALFIFAAIACMRASQLSVAERSILIGLICAYAFHSLFVFDNLMSSVYFFALLSLAHGMSKRELPRAMILTRPMSDSMFAVAAPLAVVVVLAGSYFLNAPGMATASTLITAMTPQKEVTDAVGKVSLVQKDPMENLAAFKQASESSWLGRQEVIEQLLQIASTAATTAGINPSVKDAYVALATQKGAELLRARPGDARLELFYGSFLTMAGNTQEGMKHLNYAHELSPNKQTIAFELGVNGYLRAGDLPHALPLLKQAYESASAYPEAAVYYSMALLYAGKLQESDAVLTKTFGTIIVDDNRLVAVYADAKMFDRVIAIWQLRISKDKADPQKRASLAAAYKDAGSPSDAAQVIRQAIQDLPQYTAQFTDVAKQLGLVL